MNEAVPHKDILHDKAISAAELGSHILSFLQNKMSEYCLLQDGEVGVFLKFNLFLLFSLLIIFCSDKALEQKLQMLCYRKSHMVLYSYFLLALYNP